MNKQEQLSIIDNSTTYEIDKTQKSQSNILTAIYKLPDGTDIKRLKGYDLYRMRVGNVRIIYSIHEEVRIINIENIDNRGDVYKRL